jgi:TatD DNase family protein
MELFDSHCHIQSVGAFEGEETTRALWARAVEQDPDAVIKRAEAADVTRMLCVGCTLVDSQLAITFAENREQCWASVGIHPHEAYQYASDATARQEFAQLAGQPKVVAVGECGLDYFYEHSSKEDQVAILKYQIELALEHSLPIIFHVREAFDDFWPIFESYQSANRPIRGVLHSFTDTQANLERAIKHNLYVGVNGIATFTKNPMQQELYRTLPHERLILETDAPFLTPSPYRGTICEPYHIRTIAEFLAKLRSEPLETLAAATTHNARTLFGI